MLHTTTREKLNTRIFKAIHGRHLIYNTWWDKHIGLFLGRGWRKSFYYRGTAGLLAKIVLLNVRVLHRLRGPIEDLLNARGVEEQRAIYEQKIERRIWTPWLRWFLSRSF